MSINYKVRAYLSQFIVIIEKDLLALTAVAHAAEVQYKKELAEGAYEPKELMTTLTPNTTDFFYSDPYPTRCTIPIAMVCLSAIESLGSLLNADGYERDFQNSARTFFEYASNPQSENILNLLRAVFRNGMMHGFFPKGEKVGITYDSSLGEVLSLVYKENDHLIINVNRLVAILKSVFSKILADDSVHAVIEQNIDIFLRKNNSETATYIASIQSS